MAAKPKPKRKKPAKPKSLKESSAKAAKLAKERKLLQQKVNKLESQRIEVGQPGWKENNAKLDAALKPLQDKLSTVNTRFNNVQRMRQTGLNQYSDRLESAGFKGLANRVGERAGNIGTGITNRESQQYLAANAEGNEELRNILQGGISGLGQSIQDALPTATQTGQGIVGMNLGEANTALYGGNGQKGLLDMMTDAQRRIQQTTAQAQRQQMQDLGRNAEITRESLQSLSPEVARATRMFDKAATKATKLAGPTNFMSEGMLNQQNQLARQAMMQAQNYVDPTKQLAQKAISGYQGLAGLQQSAAEDAYARARQLSPEQMREADQAARESFASRGMLGSTGSVASEILNRESSIASRRAEAAGMGQLAQQGQQGLVGLASGYESDRLGRLQQMRGQAMGLSQSALGAQQSVRGEARQARGDLYDTGQFYSTYGLPLLTGQTSAQQAGLGLLSAGLGMSGQGSGMLQAGSNLGLAKYTTDREADAAIQRAKAEKEGGIWGALGSIVGSVGGPIGSAVGGYVGKKLKNY